MAKKAEDATTAERSRYVEYRDRKRGRPAREVKPHGTVAAARRHEYYGEGKCPACAAVWKEYQAKMYRQRVARQS